MKYQYKQQFLEYMFQHLRIMQDNMILLENNLDKLPFKLKPYDLIRRCIYHDLDKFKKNNIDNYYKSYCHKHIDHQKIATATQNIKDTIKQHYLTSRHHVDFHISTNKPFTNIDLCEMCCDMLAREEVSSGDCGRYPIYCEKKFFVEYPEMLKYKDIMYKMFDLLIKLKQNNT